jgi:hypothetical protein
MIPEVQDLGFRKKNVNTSRESFGSPKFQTNYEFSMAIPSSEQIENQNKQFMKTRDVVCVDIHTYLQRMEPKSKDFKNRDYSNLFPSSSSFMNFNYTTNLCLKIDVNEYFRKYQIKLSKEIRKLSKNLIQSQNNLYLRAAEEILEI